MSDSERANQPDRDHDAWAHYVYCIAESDAAQQLPAESSPEAIEENTRLEWIASQGLSALSSQVPLKTYDEAGLAEHLSEPSWTAIRAMRHEQVVEYFAKRASVVPLRFGTIYLERAGVERMLAERSAELKAIIERLRGREEWGVNVFCDQSVMLASITSLSSRLRDLAAQAENSSPGQSYLMQKKIEALRVDEARAEVSRIVDRVEKALSDQSTDAKRLRILKVEATEHGELKAKFAFLVERAGFEEFRDVAERLAQENRDAGVRLELTGPWPAYNFAVS